MSTPTWTVADLLAGAEAAPNSIVWLATEPDIHLLAIGKMYGMTTKEAGNSDVIVRACLAPLIQITLDLWHTDTGGLGLAVGTLPEKCRLVALWALITLAERKGEVAVTNRPSKSIFPVGMPTYLATQESVS